MSNLSVRALSVLAYLGVKTPDELRSLAFLNGLKVDGLHRRIPGCGPKTTKEILEWYESGMTPIPMPETVWLRLFQDADGRWQITGASTWPQDGWVPYAARPTTPGTGEGE